MAHNQTIGQAGEDAATAYLVQRGFEILDRNWRCRYGEVDIVAGVRSGGSAAVAFVEVKTRTMLEAGHPLEAVSAHKLRRMRQVAFAWRDAHPGVLGATRIDAIGVYSPIGRETRIRHVENLLV